MKSIDLNADLGEGGANDAALMPLVSSANIACGGHAGDAGTMRDSIRLAMAAGVAIGAHPGYADRGSFGRRSLDLPATRVREMLDIQLDAFRAAAAEAGACVRHVKPHGALYNQADRSPPLAAAVIAAAARAFPDAVVFGPPGGCLESACAAAGIGFVAEGFADRRYRPDGALVPRVEPGAVIDDPASAAAQAMEIALHSRVRAIDGSWVSLPARTLCVHGDGAAAVSLLARLRAGLVTAGFRIGL